MNEHRNQDRLPESTCPLGPVSELEKDSRSFYLGQVFSRKRYQGRFEPDLGKKLGGKRPLQLPSEGIVEFDGKSYRRIPGPSIVWHQADDDVNYLSLKMEYEPRSSPRHFHTAFVFLRRPVHIDFVRFVGYGPISVVNEFLVFSAGRFITRGGNCGAPPANGSINWPLASQMEESLITIDGLVKVEAMELKDAQVGFWTSVE
jgi:hypothetical protein